jgi:transcription factor TFIIIB component B''
LPPNSSTEKGKRGKKKSDEKTPLEIKKAIMKRKLASGDVDRSKLTMFDLIYYNPEDGERP